MLKSLWTRLTVPTEWTPVAQGDRWVMRRRVGSVVETRECAEEEAREAAWFWAIK